MIDSSHSIHIYIHPAKSCFARSSSSHVLSCPVRSHVQFNTNDRRILCRKPSLIYQSNHSSAHSENTIASRSSMLNTSKSRFGRMPKTSPVTINTKSNRILFSLAGKSTVRSFQTIEHGVATLQSSVRWTIEGSMATVWFIYHFLNCIARLNTT